MDKSVVHGMKPQYIDLILLNNEYAARIRIS